MIYLDSSALLKLLLAERETTALGDWLDGHVQPRTTSELSVVEVVRACRRAHPDALAPARSLLRRLDLVPLTSVLVEEAAALADPLLRSLDALHLASALALGPVLTSFVAYDRRLVAAAQAAGLDVVQPGA